MRFVLGLGFNDFRVFVNKPPVPSLGLPGWDTPPLSVALDFLRWMASEGARVELTLCGSRVDLSFIPSWIEALQDVENVEIEGVNEPGHPEQWETSDPVSDFVVPRLGRTLYATGDYDPPQRSARGRYLVVHDPRDQEWPRKSKSTVDLWNGWTEPPPFPSPRIPVVCDEPIRPESAGFVEDDFLAYFAIAGLFGAGARFHTLSGQFCQMPTDDEIRCAHAALRGLNAFPVTAPNDGGYVHDTNDEGVSGSLRTYRSGPYGVRVRPKGSWPILIGV